jgi:putative transposase
MMHFDSLRQKYLGQHLWARGYFSFTSGNVTDEMIKSYIENQSHDVDDEEFKVE